jgi:hypothetical protein
VGLFSRFHIDPDCSGFVFTIFTVKLLQLPEKDGVFAEEFGFVW